MAAASSAPAKCCIHFPSNKTNEEIKSFSDSTFEKCLDVANRWIKYPCFQADIAYEFLAVSRSRVMPELPSGLGFHRSCYQKFTRKDRLLQLEKREGNQNAESPSVCDDTVQDSKSTNDQTPVKKLRSTDALTSVAGPSKHSQRSQHVLPSVCIFCKTDRKTKVDKTSKKRVNERLQQCELVQSDRLLKAALAKQDEQLLLQIQDRDLVAIELRYHHSCFLKYTNETRDSEKSTDIDKGTWRHSQSYSVFKEKVIINKLVKKGKALRMTRLTELLKETAKKVENLELHVKLYALKCKLQRDFPQLIFIQPKARNQSEVVLYEGVVSDFVVPASEDDLPVETDSSEENASSSSESGDDQELPGQSRLQPDTRALYHVSMELRHQVEEASNFSSTNSIWPPQAKHMSQDIVERIVPVHLFNALAWIVGATSDYVKDSLVTVSEADKRKLLSICQDILCLSHKGRMFLPKHYALGMAVRHLSNSSTIISLLNGLGHSMSHPTVLQHDTALAELQVSRQSNVPEGFHKKTFTCLAWDNNDFGEETLTGKGTTHNTNGITVQRAVNDVHDEEGPVEVRINGDKQPTRSRQRTLRFVEEPIPDYHARKKIGPPHIAAYSDNAFDALSHMESGGRTHKLDLAMAFTKLNVSEGDGLLPGWTGFNILLNKDVPPKSKVGYLPVINGSPTLLKTVNVVFEKSIAIADELELDAIVLVFDLAFYTKAQQVRWHSNAFMDRTVVRLGEFHMCMSFLSVIGKRFLDSGFSDVIVEAEIIAQGSLQSVVKGRHYNRSMRVLKIVAEALRRLQLDEFQDSLDDKERDRFKNMCQKLREAFPQCQFMENLNAPEFQEFESKLSSHIHQKCQKLPTYAFWHSYLQMADLLLTFVPATREGDWELHLATAAKMLPWYFAYDHLNYARYIPVYLHEMQHLQESHPSIATCLPGNFVVQQQDHRAFSQTAMDQTIEQTCNRDTKTKGGLTGFTQSDAAVHRWILSHSKRAEITMKCHEMAGTTSHESKTVNQARADLDESHVKNVMDTFRGFQNPFTYCVEELVNISTGQVLPEQPTDDLLSAYEKGSLAAQSFIQDRITKRTTDFNAPIKKTKLQDFSSASKVSSSRARSAETRQLKIGKEMMTRLLLVARDRNLDLKELLSYNLTQFPPSISSSNGCLLRTTKAMLLHFFETKVPEILVEKPQSQGALIVDAMATVQELADFTPSTFGDLSVLILRHIMKLASYYNASRVDFVCDRYSTISIKNAERNRRTGGAHQGVQRALSASQKTPQQFRKYLMSGNNKESLCLFLVCHWETLQAEAFCGRTLYATQGNTCCRFLVDTNNAIHAKVVAELACDHEEADTRLLLHAKHASADLPCVVIKSPDTDVFLLCITNASKIPCLLYFSTGCGNNSRMLSVNPVAERYDPAVSKALVGFHAFTGCDSTSALKGKGKIKPLQLMLQTPAHVETFAHPGDDWEITPQQQQSLEEYVCQLYGQCTSSVNEARLNIFRTTCKSDHTLPPNSDCLFLHAQRANYQAAIWRRCMTPIMSAPSPCGHGWTPDTECDPPSLCVEWMKTAPAPSSLAQLVKCSCKKGNCTSNRCKCRSGGMPCTDICHCLQCSNVSTESLPGLDIDSDDTECYTSSADSESSDSESEF